MSEQLEPTLTKSSRTRRIAAFLVDHFVMTFLMVSAIFLLLGPDFMDESSMEKITSTMLGVMIPGLLLYFGKESYKGISVGKWVMGIMVRDESD